MLPFSLNKFIKKRKKENRKKRIYTFIIPYLSPSGASSFPPFLFFLPFFFPSPFHFSSKDPKEKKGIGMVGVRWEGRLYLRTKRVKEEEEEEEEEAISHGSTHARRE